MKVEFPVVKNYGAFYRKYFNYKNKNKWDYSIITVEMILRNTFLLRINRLL